MPEPETLKWLEDQIDAQIRNFDSSRTFYRSANFYLTLSTAVLSASTTVLIGTKEIVGVWWLAVLSLICSAAVTVAAAYDGFLRSKELWILNNDTVVGLKTLKATITYAKVKSSGTLSQDEIDGFYKAFESGLAKANEAWRSLRVAQWNRPSSQKEGDHA